MEINDLMIYQKLLLFIFSIRPILEARGEILRKIWFAFCETPKFPSEIN